jgi:hypothetical protein
MGNKTSSQFVDWVDTEDSVTVIPVKLEVRQSGCVGSDEKNLGVFACEFIPAGTYICKTNPDDVNEDSISRMCNDLGYTGSAKSYDENYAQAETASNLVYVNVSNTFGLEAQIAGKPRVTFVRALRDIQPGEELSRHYGRDYWYTHEYMDKHEQTIKAGGIPQDYLFVDEYRRELQFNHCWYVFAKSDGENRYHYVIGYGVRPKDYVKVDEFNSLPVFGSEFEAREFVSNTYGPFEDSDNPNESSALDKFFWKYKYLINVSKPELTRYGPDEPISYNGTQYWATRPMQKKWRESQEQMKTSSEFNLPI